MLRKVKLSDSFDLMTINEVALGYSKGHTQTSKQLTQLLSQDHHFLLGFEEEKTGRLVGYIHAEIYQVLYADTGLNVLALAVLPDYQRRGIGRNLLQELEKLAIDKELHFIRLNSAEKRTQAHSFYLRAGFQDDKLQKRFIKYI